MGEKVLSRRDFLRLAGVAAAGAALAACGAPATPEPTAEPEEAPTVAPEAPPAEGAKITVWGWPTAVMRSRDAEGNDLLIQRVLEDTGVEMEQTLVQHPDYPATLKAAIPAGTGPDVVATDWDILGPYWSSMTPLNPFGEAEWGSGWKTDLYIQAATDEMELVAGLAGKSGDAMYLPGNMQLLGWLYYWIEDFEANGIDKDSLKAWADFEEAVGVLQAAGLTAISPDSHPAFQVDWFQSLVEVAAPGKMEKAQVGDGKITDPEIVAAFDLLAKVFNEFMPEGAIGMDISAGATMFHNHEVVMSGYATGTPWFGNLNSEDEVIRSNMNSKYGTFMVPGSKGLAATDAGVAIVADSENKEAAWEFLKWTSVGNGAKYMSDLGEPVAYKELTPPPQGTDFDKNLGTPLYTALQTGSNKFRRILCTDIYQNLVDVIPGVVVGQVTAEQAAAELQETLETRCGQWLG